MLVRPALLAPNWQITNFLMAPGPDLYERLVWTALKAYKWTLSPLIGRQCRFMPSCSEYAAQVLVEHGPIKGSWLAVGRVCRCRPLAAWGYDPPPPGPRARVWTAES